LYSRHQEVQKAQLHSRRSAVLLPIVRPNPTNLLCAQAAADPHMFVHRFHQKLQAINKHTFKRKGTGGRQSLSTSVPNADEQGLKKFVHGSPFRAFIAFMVATNSLFLGLQTQMKLQHEFARSGFGARHTVLPDTPTTHRTLKAIDTAFLVVFTGELTLPSELKDLNSSSAPSVDGIFSIPYWCSQDFLTC